MYNKTLKTFNEWHQDIKYIGLNIYEIIDFDAAMNWNKDKVTEEVFIEIVATYCDYEWSMGKL